jgi:nitrogen fixation protein FixH
VVGRTTFAGEDVTPEFTYKGGLFIAPITLEPGAWLIHLEARAADGTPFRKRMDIFVKG